jgi:hypothetical protein
MNKHKQYGEKDHVITTPDNHKYRISMAADGTWIGHLFSPQSTINGSRTKILSCKFGGLNEALRWAGIE